MGWVRTAPVRWRPIENAIRTMEKCVVGVHYTLITRVSCWSLWRAHVCRRWIESARFHPDERRPHAGDPERAARPPRRPRVFSRRVQLGVHEGALHVPRLARTA